MERLFWMEFNHTVKRQPQNCPRVSAGRLLQTVAAVVLGTLVFTASPASAQSESSPEPAPVDVDVVADRGPAADRLVERLREEVDALFSPQRSVSLTVSHPADAASRDATRPRQADALVAVGPVSTAYVCRRASEPDGPGIPAVAVSTGSGIFAPDASSGCVVVGPQGWPSDAFRAFQRLTSYDQVDVVVDRRVANGVPDATGRVARAAKQAGVNARLVPMDRGAADIQTEESSNRAVFLDHVDRWSADDIRAFTQAMTAQSVPVFAYDPAHVDHHGALAAPDRIDRVRARRAALEVEAIVKGTPDVIGETTGTNADVPTPLVVNTAVAERQQIGVPLSLRVDARLVTSGASGEATTLAASMQESIRANLRLRAERQRTSAAANNVDVARSRLLPSVNAQARGRLVNEDLAQASLGSQPEEMLTSSVSVRQVLFSEPAFARFSVEKRMQAMREFERQSVRLDAAEDAANAYVGVLQAEAAVKIQRENVRVVRTNLRAAQTRRRAGQADPREVSRLETQKARAEQGLLRAIGRLEASKIQYNRVLNRPLDAPVRLDRATGVDPRPVLQQFPYEEQLDRQTATSSFKMFWVQEARTRAPEVQAVTRLVSARERQMTSANRAFWMPEVSIEGSLSERMYEGGVGTSGLGTIPGSDGLSIPTPPDQQWSLGLTASFPIFDGTERAAQRRRASDQLEAAKTQRMIAELGVEQKVRTALVQLETSYEAVQRALIAADAAQRTLDVTQAAYREGTATLVDLIDAQTTALTTRQEASDAAYGLIRDWIAVQRAGGSFRALRTPGEQDDFEARLTDFLPSNAASNAASNQK